MTQTLEILKDPKNITVHLLRKNGFKVKIATLRWLEYQPLKPQLVYRRSITFDDANRAGKLEIMAPVRIAANGGMVQISVTAPNKTEYSESVKCSKKDIFSRKIGIRIGLGKIMKRYMEDNNGASNV